MTNDQKIKKLAESISRVNEDGPVKETQNLGQLHDRVNQMINFLEKFYDDNIRRDDPIADRMNSAIGKLYELRDSLEKKLDTKEED